MKAKRYNNQKSFYVKLGFYFLHGNDVECHLVLKTYKADCEKCIWNNRLKPSKFDIEFKLSKF